MATAKSGKPVAVISAVLILLSVAAVFLLQNFRDVPFAESWPLLPMAVGLCLAVAGYIELGLAILGFFLLALLSAMDVYPLSKSWPFTLVLIAFLVVVGYLRTKSAKRKAS